MAARSLSQDAALMLDQGMTVNQLCRAFKMDHRTVNARLAAVKPSGSRDGYNTYSLRAAAIELVPLPNDVVAKVMRLNHMDLPPMLKKEYWTGQAQMYKVQELEGELWRTESVLEYVGTAFKDIRMAIMLASDTVERETELSERQREAVKTILDNLLENIRAKLTDTFKAKRGDPTGHNAGGKPKPGLADELAEAVADL